MATVKATLAEKKLMEELEQMKVQHLVKSSGGKKFCAHAVMDRCILSIRLREYI